MSLTWVTVLVFWIVHLTEQFEKDTSYIQRLFADISVYHVQI